MTALAVLAVLSPASSAARSKVVHDGAKLLITNGAGRSHIVVGADRGQWGGWISDRDGLRAGGGCRQKGRRFADCTSNYRKVYFSLGGGNDHIDISNLYAPVYAHIVSGFGGKGNDVLRGGNSNDRIAGGTGRDILYGGDGYDVLICGGGFDIAYVDGGDRTSGCERLRF